MATHRSHGFHTGDVALSLDSHFTGSLAGHRSPHVDEAAPSAQCFRLPSFFPFLSSFLLSSVLPDVSAHNSAPRAPLSSQEVGCELNCEPQNPLRGSDRLSKKGNVPRRRLHILLQRIDPFFSSLSNNGADVDIRWMVVSEFSECHFTVPQLHIPSV